jgi:hypothetical protein
LAAEHLAKAKKDFDDAKSKMNEASNKVSESVAELKVTDAFD